jgi:hypothetical protein
LSDVVSPDYSLFLGRRLDDIKNLHSFRPLRDLTIADTGLTTAFRVAHFDTIFLRYLLPVAAGVLADIDNSQALESAVRSRLDLLDDFLRKETHTVKMYAPLLNCKSECADVELGYGIRINEISDRELESYINSVGFFKGKAGIHELLNLNFQLETFVELPRTGPYLQANDEHFAKNSYKLLRSFRLLKRGALGIAFVGGEAISPLRLGSTWMTGPQLGPLYGDTYEFSKEDLVTLQELLPRLEKIEEDKRFSLGIKRFIAAYLKPFDGDRLIDYWIALEALLMPESEAELKYRVSLRAASFIAPLSMKREVFEQMGLSYNARSKFVHGVDFKIDSELVVYTEDRLRDVLRKCIELGKAPSREMLDSLVVGDAALPG